MLKKIFLLIIISVCLSCTTLIQNNNDNYPKKNKSVKVTSHYIDQKKKISDNVISEADPYVGDFASMILELINNKNWSDIASYSDQNLYDSYIVDYKVSIEDYCMFILNTGADGSTTEHSLNKIHKAFYTKSYTDNENIVFQGEYLYPTGETEQFKLMIKPTEKDLVITRN